MYITSYFYTIVAFDVKEYEMHNEHLPQFVHLHVLILKLFGKTLCLLFLTFLQQFHLRCDTDVTSERFIDTQDRFPYCSQLFLLDIRF